MNEAVKTKTIYTAAAEASTYQWILSVLILVSCYTVNVFQSLWKYTLLAGLLLLVFEMIKENALPSGIAWTLFLFFGLNFFSTALNGNLTVSLIKLYMAVVTYIFWCDFYCREYTDIFLFSHLAVVGAMLAVQVAFQLFDSDFFGTTESENMVNFLVSDNFTGYYFVPIMLLAAIAALCTGGAVRALSWIVVALGLVSILLSVSGTCVIGGMLFAGLLLTTLVLRGRFSYPLVVFYIIYLAFLVGILVFSIQDYAADFLKNVLGKTTTFSGRTIVWAEIPSYILKKPLFGYGTGTGGRAEIIWIGSNCTATYLRNHYWNAHNYFFAILLEGGLTQFAAYVCGMAVITVKLRKCGDKLIGNVIKIGILAMLVMYTAEGTILNPPQYLVFILAFYSDRFIRKCREAANVKTEHIQDSYIEKGYAHV